WLQRVGHRLSLDIRRSKKRRSARENKHHEMNRTRLGDGNNTGQVDLDETKRILRDELDKLPSKYRLPLILHYFGGLKPDEMARELGCKTSTLGVRLHRGRKLLADSMKGRGITLSGGLLSAMLLSLVQHGIEDTILHHTTRVVGRVVTTTDLLATSIPLHVMSITRAAAKAVGLAKAKAVIALVLIVASLAGAKELVNKFQPFGVHIEFNLANLIRPLMRNFLRPLQFSTTSEPEKTKDEPQPKAPEAVVVQAPPKTLAVAPKPLPVVVAEATKAEVEVSPAAEEMASESSATRVSPLARVVQSHSVPGAGMLSPLVGAAASTNTATSVAPLQQYAGGVFKQFGGVRQYDSLRLDSISSLHTYEMSGGRVTANNAVIGDKGNGSFKQTGGQVNVARDVTLGASKGAAGTYAISGPSKLTATKLSVGSSGDGEFTQSGGETHIREKLTVGDSKTGNGSVKITNGTFTAGSADVAKSGHGTFRQEGGNVSIGDAYDTVGGDGKFTIAVDPTSRGEFSITSGTFEARGISVGRHGNGSFAQDGGQTSTQTINVAESDSASGTAAIKSGDVYFDVRSSPTGAVLGNSNTTSGLVVGDRGNANLVLGDATGSPLISERPGTSGASLVVRAQPDSQGIVRGWGAPKLTGSFIQNGQVVADGFGEPRELDLSTLQGVVNTIENAPNESNGWYARRGGRLILPPITIDRSGGFNWGESPDDKSPDLVNSVRLSMHNVEQRGTAQLTLLTPNDPSIPGLPHGEKFLGVWCFEGNHLKFESADLWIRYDDSLASALGVDPSTLKIWTFNESWKLGGLIDLLPDQRLIGATASDFRYFAVAGSDHPIAAPSAEFVTINPEPGTFGLLLIGGCAWLARRPRRLRDLIKRH
ncbi:MAG TPA: sigma factor-like helix-turn-helix DNA-binding protein, partial [Tepidisphaeraceae bacterium]|nr:sigma factor-like helix-turn-helix DNA-binding protein [Tepidisphaeraceae bacterium]